MYIARPSRLPTQLPIQPVVSDDREAAFPFGFDADGNTRTYTTPQKRLSARVIQLLLTSRGERRMRPTYGTGIRNLVFQRLDAVTIQEMLVSDVELARVLKIYAPEVASVNINVRTSDPLDGTVKFIFMITASGPDLSVHREEVTLA